MRWAVLMFFLVVGSAHANLSADGVWRTQASEDGAYLTVEIGACADNAARVCGVILDLIDGNGESAESEAVGKYIIQNMRPVDGNDGSWHKGSIWAPDDDKTYKSKMALVEDGLKVSGCVFGGLICRSQVWQRVE